MTIAQAAAWFFGALLLVNAVPHVVAGVLGRPFQTPFATPPGEGLSSSTVNVLWGFANLVGAWVLLVRIAGLDLHDWRAMGVAGVGGLVTALFHARHFGRFHGGNRPE